MKKIAVGALPTVLFLFLLCFPHESLEAARSGLLLWYGTLVPTLLPVMILSRFLLDTGLAQRLTAPLSRPLGKLLSVSPSGVYALLVGFLCGCPMGAKVLSDLRRQDRISGEEAAYLVRFCNNLSPAFLTNYLVLGHLGSDRLVAPTLCILFGAPLLYGLLTNRRYRSRLLQTHAALRQKTERASGKSSRLPSGRDGSLTPLQKNKTPAMAISFAMVDACITDSICSITKLGGYILLFSVFTAMAGLLPCRTPLAGALASAMLEISGGVHRIAALPLPFSQKYLLLTAASASGGLCCAAQSAQMLTDIGLPLRSYLSAKLQITMLAVLLAACYVR